MLYLDLNIVHYIGARRTPGPRQTNTEALWAPPCRPHGGGLGAIGRTVYPAAPLWHLAWCLKELPAQYYHPYFRDQEPKAHTLERDLPEAELRGKAGISALVPTLQKDFTF